MCETIDSGHIGFSPRANQCAKLPHQFSTNNQLINVRQTGGCTDSAQRNPLVNQKSRLNFTLRTYCPLILCMRFCAQFAEHAETNHFWLFAKFSRAITSLCTKVVGFPQCIGSPADMLCFKTCSEFCLALSSRLRNFSNKFCLPF